jgi:GntR family transcriptional regulator
MNYIHLNKFLTTPLYLQLKNSIKNAILSGELKDKEKLPTEESICSVFNISRPVVRQAYNELIKEGLINRIQGKGSYVQKKLMISNLMYTVKGFAKEVEEIGLKPESTIISKEIDKRENLPFELQQLNEDFYLIKRIRKGSNIPLFLEYFYLPVNKYRNFENLFYDNTGFTKVLKESYGYDELEIRTTMNAILADEILADLLEIKIEDPVFKFIVRTQRRENEDLFAYKLSFFPGDKHQIEIIEKGDRLYGIHKD